MLQCGGTIPGRGIQERERGVKEDGERATVEEMYKRLGSRIIKLINLKKRSESSAAHVC